MSQLSVKILLFPSVNLFEVIFRIMMYVVLCIGCIVQTGTSCFACLEERVFLSINLSRTTSHNVFDGICIAKRVCKTKANVQDASITVPICPSIKTEILLYNYFFRNFSIYRYAICWLPCHVRLVSFLVHIWNKYL
jgi:hypothetical protein